MVNNTHEIIDQIKEASDNAHVKTIIENSIRKLNVKNVSGVRIFILNMIITLIYVKADSLSAKASENVSAAIDVLEGIRKQEHSYLF